MNMLKDLKLFRKRLAFCDVTLVFVGPPVLRDAGIDVSKAQFKPRIQPDKKVSRLRAGKVGRSRLFLLSICCI